MFKSQSLICQISSVCIHTGSPSLSPRAWGRTGGAKHVGVCFDLLRRWRHIPCGLGAGSWRVCPQLLGGTVGWRDGGSKGISSMQNAGRELLPEQAVENFQPHLQRGMAVLSPSPTLTDATQPTCYACATLLTFQFSYFVWLVFLSAQKAPEGIHLRIFQGVVCVCVCGVMFTWRLSASFHCG